MMADKGREALYPFLFSPPCQVSLPCLPWEVGQQRGLALGLGADPAGQPGLVPSSVMILGTLLTGLIVFGKIKVRAVPVSLSCWVKFNKVIYIKCLGLHE